MHKLFETLIMAVSNFVSISVKKLFSNSSGDGHVQAMIQQERNQAISEHLLMINFSGILIVLFI